MSRHMNIALNGMVAALVLVLAVGCTSSSKPAASTLRPNSSVTDITPAPPPAPVYQPVTPVAPVTNVQPVADFSTAPAITQTPAGGGRTYIVQKGDTLYKIARVQYGDPKAWQKIAAANPTASNGLIKPGQKLVLP